MKLIKAYIRTSMIDTVIHALERSHILHMSVSDIHEVGEHIDREHAQYSMEYTTDYTPMVQIEIACREEQVEKIISVIAEEAQTGKRGDGIIVIMPVEEALHIRTGERGNAFL